MVDSHFNQLQILANADKINILVWKNKSQPKKTEDTNTMYYRALTPNIGLQFKTVTVYWAVDLNLTAAICIHWLHGHNLKP